MVETTESLIQQVLAIAQTAGQRILAVAERPLCVSTKTDKTPVCNADIEAHRVIVEGLHALEPKLPILSEESPSISFRERNDWTDYWLVDPLDGTRGFIKGRDEFTVNIALVRGAKPILGVIVAPKLNVAYFAAEDCGAFKQTDNKLPVPIHVRDANAAELTVACSGATPQAGSRMQQFLDSLGAHKAVAAGAALKSCLVAEGAADVYARLGPTGEWDTAAAQIIVEEAGGHLTDTTMQDLRYNTRESLTNPHFVVFGDTRIDWLKHLKPQDTAKG